MEVDGVYIILENSGGPIDSHFVPHIDEFEPDLNKALVAKLREWELAEGDTIKFREGRAGLTVDQLRSHLFA
jgi:hypothetical protein